MALKSSLKSTETAADVKEQLDALQALIDRTKILYEQYFLGIQKVAPIQLHHDLERKIRDRTQQRIANTAQRFRFSTMSQKFGSYHTYWRRTMRQIEQGRYLRDIARVRRKAERTGEDIPAEILAAMPKLMREKIERDRSKLAERAESQLERSSDAARSSRRVQNPVDPSAHRIDEDDPFLGGDVDMDSIFSNLISEAEAATSKPREAAPVLAPPPAAAPVEPRTRAGAWSRRNARPSQGAVPSAPRSPAAPIPPRPQQPSRPQAQQPPGMTEAQTRHLFKQYVAARKVAGQRTDNLSYDGLLRTLNKQAPAIMKKHNATGVEFRVELKSDKVIFKAKPKRSG